MSLPYTLESLENSPNMKVFNFLQDDGRTLLSEISSNRSYLMGVAMLLVLVYHLFCWVANPIGPLNIGYVGVDVFLFLSGFGLRRSFETNSLTKFYANRFKRIYPLYFVAVCAAYLIYRNIWSPSDFFYNLTTLGYYVHAGMNRFDWYLESLFTLYLLFPLFYYYSKTKYTGLAILLCATFLCLLCFDIPWWYDCLIGRLPVFLYGIIFSEVHKHIKAISISGVILFPFIFFVSHFLASSLLTLPVIIISIGALPYIKPKVKSTIEFFGKYSLETYCANVLMHKTLSLYATSFISKFVIYVVLQAIFTIILIYINKKIQRFIK